VPLYEFRCPECGRFDVLRDMQDAGDITPCPSCDHPAQRLYTVSGGRPSMGRSQEPGKADRARMDRARSGEPVITGPPSGRRLPRRSGHYH
jgi:putative FmdB family regulatory protein